MLRPSIGHSLCTTLKCCPRLGRVRCRTLLPMHSPTFTAHHKIDLYIIRLRYPESSSGTTSVRFEPVRTTVFWVPPGA